MPLPIALIVIAVLVLAFIIVKPSPKKTVVIQETL
jgi:hypothetical protein